MGLGIKGPSPDEGSLTLVLIQRYIAKGRKLSKLIPEFLKKGYGGFP